MIEHEIRRHGHRRRWVVVTVDYNRSQVTVPAIYGGRYWFDGTGELERSQAAAEPRAYSYGTRREAMIAIAEADDIALATLATPRASGRAPKSG